MGDCRGVVGITGRPESGDWQGWKPTGAIMMRATGNDWAWAKQATSSCQFFEVSSLVTLPFSQIRKQRLSKITKSHS